MASVYVHFPYCLAKCPYCDFVSYASDRASIDHAGYADAVIREAEARAKTIAVRGVTSVFFGGGTPSLWDSGELGRVLEKLTSLFEVAPGSEITVECNPTSLDEEKARALKDAGVNRLSIGTQSLRKEQLGFLGRLHDPEGARRAIDGALAAGLPRVSTDLIFGLPGQSAEDAREQAESLAGLGLSHLSCYQLTIEPGTQFGARAKRGLFPKIDEGAVADAFLAIDETLEARGLRHYEISNYARPGHEAQHNLAYWRGDEYVGLGCGAYGFTGRTRYRNEIDPRAYVAKTRELRDDVLGEGDGLTISAEVLEPAALLRERIMLGLRIVEGVDLGRARKDLGIEPWTEERTKTVESLVAKGRLERSGDTLTIPKPAWLFTDDTAARLF